MASSRIIKKYPNRRLYDTKESRYITITNVKELVMSGEEFQVIDTNTSEDLTRTILLQIIMEEESHGKPIFSEDALFQLIKFYGGAVQGVFGQYLEESMSAFTKKQHMFSEGNGAPIQNITEIAQQNMKMWTEMQSSFFTPPSNKDNSEK